MTQYLIAAAFGIGIPGTFGAIATAFAIAKDGSPLRRDWWTS